MTIGDLDSVIEVEKRAYTFPWSKGIFTDCIRAGYDCRLLCYRGEIAGHAVMSTGAGEAHLLNICIRRELQGQGFGRLFVHHVLARARFLEADTIYLEVRPSNKKALQLYESIGFIEVGIRKDYYPDTNGREDALVLALNLTD